MTETGKRVMVAIGLGGLGSMATVAVFGILMMISPLHLVTTDVLVRLLITYAAIGWVFMSILAFVALSGVDK